jgi:Na+-translocating ferredoxin:NAD+ oxidoreductase subunit G
MNTSAKMIIVLTLIAVLSGAVLSSWDKVTQPRIEAFRQMELEKAIAEVLPPHDSVTVKKTENFTFYVGHAEGKPAFVALQAVGSGFQGKILMMAGLDLDFSQITGLKILEQVETPGLGTKIVTDPSRKENPTWFTDQFKSLIIQPEITYVKNAKPSKDSEIEAITGATISSVAIVNILNDTFQKARTEFAGKAQE